MKRNGFIDVAKFSFAIVIAEFHVYSGVFLGGRVGVEAFFMISAYLMMCSLAKDPCRDNIAISTVKFIWRKYKALFYFLLPATVLSYALYCAFYEYTLLESLAELPLIIFDLIPLHATGITNEQYLGISWYISAMLLSMAILYPLCKKFRRSFTLLACPLIGVFGYGILCFHFRSLAINYQIVPETIIRTGFLRGFACCALGCFLYEMCQLVNGKTPTRTCRAIFTCLELLGYTYMAFVMHHQYASPYEYVVVFVIFGLLFIGINGLSVFSYLWRYSWTKYLGTASTLIVLCHVPLVNTLEKALGPDFAQTPDFWWYPLSILLFCSIVYACSVLLKLLFAQLKKIKLWQEPKA